MIETLLGALAIFYMVIAYASLNWVKYSNLFLIFNAISCLNLLMYSIFIKDWVFISVNIIAASSLTMRLARGGIAK